MMNNKIVSTLMKTLKKILIAAAVLALWHYSMNDGGIENLLSSGFIVAGLVFAGMAWSQFFKDDGETSFSMMGQRAGLRNSGDEMASRAALQSTVLDHGAQGSICWISSLLAALVFLIPGLLFIAYR